MSTNNPMTQERLDAIQAREAKATAGPWAIDGPAQCGPSDTLVVYPVEDGGTLAYVQPSWDDAEFIAHARQDVPALLAEVERLRALTTVDDDTVGRATRAFGAATAQVSSVPLGMSEDMFIDSVGLQHQHAIRAALDAALNTGEEA